MLEDRLAQRAATGVYAEAIVTEVETFWFSLILDGRGSKTRRLTVEYEVGGSGYRSQLMWVKPADDPDIGRGDTIDVYADVQEPTQIATTTGGGSDGWALAAPRAIFRVWAVAATVLCLVMLAAGTRRITVAGRATSTLSSPDTAKSGSSIPKAYRGYNVVQVDAAIEQMIAARDSGSDTLYRITCNQVAKNAFRTVLYGYDRARVHELMTELCSDVLTTAPATIAARTTFTVVMRGYDRVQVDTIVKEVEAALESDNPSARWAALEMLSTADFEVTLRGYDRQQVRDWKAHMTGQLRQGLPS